MNKNYARNRNQTEIWWTLKHKWLHWIQNPLKNEVAWMTNIKVKSINRKNSWRTGVQHLGACPPSGSDPSWWFRSTALSTQGTAQEKGAGLPPRRRWSTTWTSFPGRIQRQADVDPWTPGGSCEVVEASDHYWRIFWEENMSRRTDRVSSRGGKLAPASTLANRLALATCSRFS